MNCRPSRDADDAKCTDASTGHASNDADVHISGTSFRDVIVNASGTEKQQ
jgi:hypothetical protein